MVSLAKADFGFKLLGFFFDLVVSQFSPASLVLTALYRNPKILTKSFMLYTNFSMNSQKFYFNFYCKLHFIDHCDSTCFMFLDSFNSEHSLFHITLFSYYFSQNIFTEKINKRSVITSQVIHRTTERPKDFNATEGKKIAKNIYLFFTTKCGLTLRFVRSVRSTKYE